MDDKNLKMTPAALAAAARGDMVNAVIAATPGGIERQEKEGQLALTANFNTLPKNMGEQGWEIAERLGFVRLSEGGDDLFEAVTAPSGWSLRATDHSMHSEIVDPAGRVRGGVFYKAAFYDRKAGGHWRSRYVVDTQYPEGPGMRWPRTVVLVDRANGDILASEEVAEAGERWEKVEAAEERMAAIANERFPNRADPSAYWD